ncbi:MAG: D-tyrosyl-tRNA(Tyr) deacylase [Bryobacterales bacterium]|nr:D-tyrosyl-tRNA(Tyr) deacylase [Bryobacterales bacterium]
MIAVLQRVSRASVTVDGSVTGQIGTGLLVFLGVERDDTEEDAKYLADRVVHLRVFPDTAQKMNSSLIDVSGSMLVVSQFTLAADVTRGRRPSFDGAAVPQLAALLYESFIKFVRQVGVLVETGVFQAQMSVDLTNQGPVTFICRSRPRRET